MDAQGNMQARMAPMVALTGAVVIATAAVVSAPPVQRATENIVPAAVHQVKSLPVQLAAYNPFVPYAQPVGVIGYALTTVFSTQTALLLPTFDGATQALTEAGVDPRWAQQPQLIARNLVLPIAVAVQTALVGGLEGTYVYGKFTPAEALNFFVDAVKTALEGFVAAERALFGQSALAAKASGATDSAPDASSTELPSAESVVTLSTGQVDAPAATGLKHAAAETANSDDEHPQPVSPEITDEATPLETTTAVTSVPKKPTFKLPTLKLPKLKLPTLKFPSPKKSSRPATATSGSSAANPQADDDGNGASSPKPGQSESSDRSGNTDSTAD